MTERPSWEQPATPPYGQAVPPDTPPHPPSYPPPPGWTPDGPSQHASYGSSGTDPRYADSDYDGTRYGDTRQDDASYGGAPYGGPYDPRYGAGGFRGPDAGDADPRRTPGRGAAIAALVVAVLALLSVLLPAVPVFLGIVACVLAIIAMRRMSAIPSRGRGAGRGLAISGLVTGIIAVLLGTLVGVLYLVSWPYLGDLAQCAQHTDASTRDACVSRVLDDIARDQGVRITPGEGGADGPEEL